MAQSTYLQLYLDTDYILPVAVGADGNLVKYSNSEGECQLWLYFSKSASSDVYESGSAQKSNFEAGLSNNFGNFWEKISNGETVASEPFGYVDLLEVSGLLGYLRDCSLIAVRRAELTALLCLSDSCLQVAEDKT